MFKWVHYSPPVLKIFKERLVSPIIGIFEKRIREVIKKFSEPNKKDELAALFKRSLIEKSTFEENLENYFKKQYPTGSGRSAEYLDKVEDELIANKDLMIQRISNDNSFLDTLPQHSKGPQLASSTPKLVVPLLNLPIGNHRDSNPNIISRSTRRHEMMNKSSVSTSNRIQHQWSGEPQFNLSREPSLRDRRVSGGNEANMSYLDEVHEFNNAHLVSLPLVVFI